MLKVPLGIFWDLKSCSIPDNRSPYGVSKTIRGFIGNTFPDCGYAYEFICAGDVRHLNDSAYDELRRNGVDIVHVNSFCQTSTEDTLRNSIEVFIDIFGTDSVFAIITADTHLEATIKYALSRGLRVALICGANTTHSLRSCVTDSYLFEDVLRLTQEKSVRHVHHGL